MNGRATIAIMLAVVGISCSSTPDADEDPDTRVSSQIGDTVATEGSSAVESSVGAVPATVPEVSVPETSGTQTTATQTTAPETTEEAPTTDGAAEESEDSDDDLVGTDPVEAESDIEAAIDTEDPSFVLGPDIELDVDVARFPADDAGIGGGSDPDDPSTPDGEPQGSPVTGWAGVDRYLESVLIRAGNTAASVAVSIDGEVVHQAAFGVRDPQIGDEAEPQDRFRIASISKPITAITVMALVEDGIIELDDPIGDVVAQHVGLASATGASAGLTFRQLLNHRSGFGKYDGTFFRGAAADCIDATRTGMSSGAGGGGYTYSNMNYCVAGLAIEAVTGLGYEQAVYRYLLTPLGISGMRLAPTFDPGPDEIQHVTTPGRNYMETLGGAGAWVATPSDLVTIMDSLAVDTGGFKPLDVETVFQMLTPTGGTLGQRGYGLGVISYGDNRFGHTGTIESTHAMVLNRGDGVIWAITVAGQSPSESTSLERIMNDAFIAGGFVAG